MTQQEKEDRVRQFLASPIGQRLMTERVCPLIQDEMDRYYRERLSSAEYHYYKEFFEFEQPPAR